MKKVFTIYLLLFCLNINAENVTLTFTGKLENTSNTVKLDSIRIENLSNNTGSTYINKSSITIFLGTIDINENTIEAGINSIYPNPFSNEVNIQYASAFEDNIDINVYNVSGQKICNYSGRVSKGLHIFRFNASERGVFFIRINGAESVYTSKVICFSNNYNASTITYTGEKKTNAKIVFKTKSAKKNDFSVIKGDQLKFTGYSGQYISNIYDLANISKSYEFIFSTQRSFHFEKHLIKTAAPCFVNIMFSVKDDLGVGVDYLSNKDFKVLEDNAAVSPSESSRYVKNINQIPYTLKTVLMLDNSQSLTANDIEKIKTAAISLVQSLGKNQEIAIYVFSSQPVLLQDFTSDVSLLTDAINSIGIGFFSTNLYGSIIKGLSEWDNTYNLDCITQGYLVVFTDGADTQGSSTLSQVLSAKGNKKIYMIGKGQEIKPDTLNQIAAPSSYISIDNTSQLTEKFATIQNDILRLANSFYWLNYMSPKRTSTHTLRVEAINNSNTGSDSYIEGSFPAANFQDVYPGVYANVSYDYSYGLDYIKCNYESSGRFRFYNTDDEILADDSLLLEASTFGAKFPPEYIWTLDDNTVVQLKPSAVYDSKAWLVPQNYIYSSAYITLEDNANGFTQDIYVDITSDLPSVTTDEPTNISYFSATCGGNVLNNGKSTVTARGVCWSKYNVPDIYNSKTPDGQGTGAFTSNITGLTDATTYYVRAYATNSYGTSYGEEYSFKTLDNKAPKEPTNPVPSDGATGITNSTLSWQCSDPEGDPLTYDIYIGISSNPQLINTGINATNFSNNKLESNKKYYWKIIAKDNYGNTTNGPLWTFTSGTINQAPSEPSNPNPANDAINVSVSTTLSWTASTDPESDPVTYDLYFGKSSNPPLVKSNISSIIYNPGILDVSTKYYWKVIAKDNKGNSSNENIWNFLTDKFNVFTDTRDNKSYKYITIGTQTWMAENLNIGEIINGSSDQTNNTKIEKYCYKNDVNNCNVYGGLYQWNEMMGYVTTEGARGICPQGWHLPSDGEWSILTVYLGGVQVAGGKMKSTSGWNSLNTGATNESGFTGLPGGERDKDGVFSAQSFYGYWWQSTENSSNSAYRRVLQYNQFAEYRYAGTNKERGFSVRCIKD